MLGDTLLLAGDRAGAIGLFERGLTAARRAGMEAYLLRSAAPLAAATGSRAMLDEAAGLLERAASRRGVPGCSATTATCRWRTRGWGTTNRNTPARCWRRCWPSRTGSRGLRPWRRRSPPTGGPSIRLGERERAGAELDRAARLAREHGLPYVLRDVREAQGELR